LAQFTDNAGDTWTLEFTIGTARRLQRALDIDVLNLSDGDPPLISRLDFEIELMVDVISVALTGQIEQRGLDADQFAERLSGGVLAQAREAMWQALSDFFQSLGRTEMVTAIETQQRVTAEAIAAGTSRIQAIDPRAETARAIDGASSSSSPASPASPPEAPPEAAPEIPPNRDSTR
jgi:hypothetical protein